MEPQLYMHNSVKEMYLERHQFFTQQIRSRILSQFADVDGDAEAFRHTEYERLGQEFREGEEEVAVALAQDNAEDFYMLLSDMKNDMELASVAAMYHRWDKDLRDFLERELNHSVEPDQTADAAWDSDPIAAFRLLKAFGWDCEPLPFFNVIQNLRLVVNVYKHGKGRSLTDVARRCPQYLSRQPASGTVDDPDYEDLMVSTEQFDQFATAIDEFWRAFPERLLLASA